MYKKNIFLFLFTCILGNFLIAQNTKFNEAFPIILGLASGASEGLMNGPNGYIMYGPTLDSNGHQDPAVAKIDSFGHIVWRKYYPRTNYNFGPFGGATELGINVPWGGGLFEIDWYNDTVSSNEYCGLYRIDGNGDTLWTKTFRDSTSFFTDEIKVTRDKKYLIYGAWVNLSDHYQGFSTLCLRKTDSLGNLIWTRTYHYTDSLTREASGIDTCSDGGYVLCAYEKDTNTNYAKLFCWNGKIMVMKTDSAGNIQWTKYISNPICNTQAFSVRTLKTGGYIVCGYWDDSLNWNGNTAFGYMYMAKLNDMGSIIWSNTYGFHSEGGDNVLYNVRELPNGDLIACGFGDSTGRPQPGVMLRTDSNGNKKWLRYYYKFYPNSANYLFDVQCTTDNGFVSCGYTTDPEDFWVIKTDSLGCDTIGCNYATGVSEVKEEGGRVKVYPNPNNGSFTISLTNINAKCSVEIYNVLGETIYKAGLTSDNTEINLNGQSPGVYFYRVLKEDGGLVSEGKIIIEK